jgi:hypothetical protein
LSESCFNCKNAKFDQKTVSLLCVKSKSVAHKQLTFYFQMWKYFCRHLHSSLISMASLLFCLGTCLPVCLSACLPVCLSACLPVCLSPSLPVSQSPSLPVSQSASLPVCQSASLPACLPSSLPTQSRRQSQDNGKYPNVLKSKSIQ